MAGAGVLTLRQAFPITLGANVGTTVTALLASLATTGPNAGAGIVIALAHLLFNVAGVTLIYPVRMIRELPLRASERFSRIRYRTSSPTWSSESESTSSMFRVSRGRWGTVRIKPS